jgi:transcriptional regulator with XRE-family HTH domain
MQASTSKRELRSRKPNAPFVPGLRRVRLQRELSMRELADLSKVSTDTIWRLENLHRGAEPKTRYKLTKALDVKMRELFRPGDE